MNQQDGLTGDVLLANETEEEKMLRRCYANRYLKLIHLKHEERDPPALIKCQSCVELLAVLARTSLEYFLLFRCSAEENVGGYFLYSTSIVTAYFAYFTHRTCDHLLKCDALLIK